MRNLFRLVSNRPNCPGHRHFGRDRAGTATVMTAFASTALLGFLAIAIDGSHYYVVKRRLQAATDMAAMAAATHLDAAESVAASAMAANGFPNATLRVSPGTFVSDPSLPPQTRFNTLAATNAVEVVSTTNEAFIFGTAFRFLLTPARAAVGEGGAASGFAIRTRAIAARQDQASLTLGTGLAALDSGILNALLGSLLGTRLSLSLIDYQSLASATVDLFSVSDALAAQGVLSGPTYGATSTSMVARSKLLNALADSVQGSVQAASALRLMSIDAPPGVSQSMGKLIDFGPAAAMRIGADHPMKASVSALDMLLAMAMLGGQDHIVSVDLGSVIPGLAATTLTLTIGEPAVQASFLAVGPQGTTLHSAQVRLSLTTQIGGAGLPTALTLPIYLELAPGSVSISTISCAGGATNASVNVIIQPGLADLWLGSVQPSNFVDLRSASPVSRATLASVAGLMRVDALAHVSLSTPQAVPTSFLASEIRAGTKKTVASGVSLSTAMNTLLDTTQISVMALGVTLPQPQTPLLVKSAIRASLAPVDEVLARTLSLLGVSLGTATVSVPGVRCGQGVLVN